MRPLLVLIAVVLANSALAQNNQPTDPIPSLARAVLDSSIALELAKLPGDPISLAEAQGLALGGATQVQIATADAAAARGAARTEAGSYDPELYGEAQYTNDDIPSASPFIGADVLRTEATSGTAGLRWTAPLGTELSASLNAVRMETNSDLALLVPEYTSYGELLMVQPLLDGFGVGQRGALTEAERRRDAADELLEEARLATLAAVEDRYWELYAAGRDFTVQRIITERAAALVDQAVTRNQVGVAGPVDVANARVFLAEQQQTLLDARELLGDTSDRLASLIGMRPSGAEGIYVPNEEPPADFPVVPVEQLIQTATARNHQIRALEREVEANRAGFDQARRNALPDLDLFGGLGGYGLTGDPQVVDFGGNQITTDIDGGLGDGLSQVIQRQYPAWRVGLSFSVPLGNRADGGERDQREADLVRAEQRLEEGRRTLDADIRSVHRALANGQERLDAARFGVDAAGEQVRIGVLEYESGRTSAFELVRLGGDLAAAQQRYSRALVRTARAAAVLRLLTGGAYMNEETGQ